MPLRSLAALLASLALFVVAPEAGAQGGAMTLERLLGAFQDMPGLHARFTEEKKLAMLAVPLRSEGEIDFAPPDRLVRRVTSPSPSTALLVGDRLTLASAGRREVLDLSANAVVEGFVDTFRHVLAGDREALERTYHVRFEANAAGWRLTLTPRTATMRRFLREMILAGEGRELRQMRMIEQNGDETTTRFSEIDARRRFSERDAARIFAI